MPPLDDTPNGIDPEALVRRYYDRVDADDVEGLLELFSETITYERPGQDPIEGRADLRAFYERDRPLKDGEHSLDAVIVDAGDTGETDVDAAIGDGDRVAVRGRFSGVQDGDPVSFGFADFHEMNTEGVIETRWTYTDRDTV
ncbi:nuclear transport factor 2 family protein [Natronosalvus halobius]|uniref:nuclear transport factor 2 family protein n=1 Tax=Natronosalvus halobius TaxID=2953746 RepID=UPI00209E8CCD|nr:nuclear transport factor 2 family protein [Natronosalvus halobius]USZ70224.1 nuclear transport factor 2 family protein [Natronosalvus halobius]